MLQHILSLVLKPLLLLVQRFINRFLIQSGRRSYFLGTYYLDFIISWFLFRPRVILKLVETEIAIRVGYGVASGNVFLVVVLIFFSLYRSC